MTSRIRIIALLALLASACSGADDPFAADSTGDEDAVGWGFDTVAPDGTMPLTDTLDTEDLSATEDLPPPDLGPDGPPTDTPLEDTPPLEDLPPVEDIPEDIGPAGAYEPCFEDDDCESLLCGWHFGDLICLPPVVDICPKDFTSVFVDIDNGDPDLVLYCVSQYSHLCLPCWSDADCQDDISADNHACAKLGSIGGFCATVSEVPGADPVCPEGYIVSNTLKLVGEDPQGPPAKITSGCVPPMGICECTQTASGLSLSTFCFSGSDEGGWCTGERVCTVDGMTACSVGPPTEEVCDGVDNDCDGETDEGICDDDDVCTKDSCGGETGCVFTPLTGTPCDDQDACTEFDQCEAGLCVGEPWESPDPGPCAEVSCDPVMGIQITNVDGPCDDEDVCTTDDHCVQGECVGDFDPPGPPPEDPCQGWTCDGIGGWFVAPLTGDPCEDGDPCTMGDVCDDGACIPGGPDPCDDSNTCTTDGCEAGVGCSHVPLPQCCGNGVTDAGEDCDDGNQESGDGCDSECVEEDLGLSFVGYTKFQHNVCEQTFDETDLIMDQACANGFGAGVKAASIPELFAGINGLPPNNNANDWVMFKCPLCEGATNYWTCNGQPSSCRKGVNSGDPWPTSADSGWNMNMCNAQRTAVCVQ